MANLTAKKYNYMCQDCGRIVNGWGVHAEDSVYLSSYAGILAPYAIFCLKCAVEIEESTIDNFQDKEDNA